MPNSVVKQNSSKASPDTMIVSHLLCESRTFYCVAHRLQIQEGAIHQRRLFFTFETKGNKRIPISSKVLKLEDELLLVNI
ncbi:hypothetical protein ATS71_18075 [Pseudoalteromonas sp. H71]|nr:hypothetical protein ATS71_18075 [Pseudoalteromonas sp. H71]